MIGHRSRLRENDDLPLRRGPVVKKNPQFSNARALITRKICAVGMRNAILGNDLNIALQKKGEKEKKFLQHGVFVFDNPSMY